ncbi:unnamed protein product [Mytilus edulis]|uniref:Uncharacterized protein n=1 Tax=Mytilus edulis TaxID=6550 RepID=A0A8S3UDF0_MYTED|nr:unnamed protein product [Mytilus edulis]
MSIMCVLCPFAKDSCGYPNYILILLLFSCFVLDSSGYIVIHEDFANPDSTSPEIENVHVIYKESAIAEDLINNNMMNKASCIDFETIKEQFTYRVVTNDIDRMNSYAKYKISPVPNSNIFIVIKQRVYTTATSSAKTRKIHIYSDSSEKAIAAVGYIQLDDDKNFFFVMGKAKVAPNHGHTLPRLELCGVLLATEIGHTISDQLDIPLSDIQYYTDSKVVHLQFIKKILQLSLVTRI